MPSKSILIVSGTNRPGANALKVSESIRKHYEQIGQAVKVFSLADLPMEIFNPSSYETKPPSWPAIQQLVIDAAGLHVVTPEYRGSMPGVLKYFVEMVDPSCFVGKPVCFTGEAAGMWGALRPIEMLSLIFAYVDAHVYSQRVYLKEVNKLFDAQGKLLDAKIEERLAKQAAGFAQYAGRFEKGA